MRFLVDTNVLSEAVRPTPSAAVVTWLSARTDRELFVSTITIAEIRRGVLQLPVGRRRTGLETWFAGPEGPQALFAGRILGFDVAAALVWSDLMAEGSRAGRPRSAIDMMVASIAAANGCTVVTLNLRHFDGIVAALDPSRA